MSPGNTSGTDGTRGQAPLLQRIKHMVMRVAPLLGIAHKLDEGARRSLTASPTALCAAESSTPGTEKGLTGPSSTEPTERW